MNYLKVAKIAQFVLAASITFFVLIQSKGTGLSSAFGGGATHYRTKRGLEKLIFGLTITFGVLFVVNSLIIVLLS